LHFLATPKSPVPSKNISFIENCSHIVGGFIGFISKHFIKFFLFVAFSHTAAAQTVGHGTYYIAAVSADFVVVTIDSRELLNYVNGPFANDRYCKIRPLSPTAFFFATGDTSVTSATVRVFDADDIAQIAYGSDARLDQLAEKWAIQMQAVYNRYSDVFAARHKAGDTVAMGFFVWTDNDANIELDGAIITYQPTVLIHFPYAINHYPLGDPNDPKLLRSGYPEIVQEFKDDGQTERARSIIAAANKEIVGKLQVDAIAIRLVAINSAVRDWSRDSGIGGEIAAIILERGKGWRWFHRPDFCPEN